jgi:magnesium transporter
MADGSSWSRSLRRVVTRMLSPDHRPLPAVSSPASPAVVDCGLYVRGQRVPGQRHYSVAFQEARRRHDGFVWLGLRDPSAEEMADVAAVFGLHELAVEDALSGDVRPKIERYGDVTAFAMRTSRYVEHSELTETSEVVETGSILMFIGARFVVTVRHGAPGALGPVRKELEERPDLLIQGPWSVAHAVCDRLVDSYIEVCGLVEADLDHVEETVFAHRTRGDIAHIYQLKRELMEFKRAVLPLQRPLATLLEDRGAVPKEIRRYFRDVNDHLLRVVDRVASFDDLVNSILQARLAQVAVDQNNDMRKIAAWAAIAAVPTALAGIYGMNFDYMPELRWKYGYVGVLVVVLVTCVGLYRKLRRSGWL